MFPRKKLPQSRFRFRVRGALQDTNMERFINDAVRTTLHHYEHATPSEFGILALGIIVVGWFITRFHGD
ncbi:MAG: hypothetical protein DWH81_10705 [Planctomycetota bacterium]|jgi:hypothetical protein|nr:MAG: hypothetical protein DWH81_10705 [Planctomycetota bacterium]